MKRALVSQGGASRIHQIVAKGQEFPVHPSLEFVDVPNKTTLHDKWDAGAVVDQPPVPRRPVSAVQILVRALVDLGVVTQDHLDAAEAAIQSERGA